MKNSRITFEDWQILSEITYDVCDSYDRKDWKRLGALLAPTLEVDYTQVIGKKWDAMPAREYLAMVSDLGFVGDPLVDTQHFIGGSKYQKISDIEVHGYHQLRAAHQRYTGPDRKAVEAKGHGHAVMKHIYKKSEGTWKFAGLQPTVLWNEFDFDKIFVGRHNSR